MERTVRLGQNEIRYTLTRKSVKNINLRVRTDGTVAVSANRRVPAESIDAFVVRNGEKILSALARFKELSEQAAQEREYPREEALAVFTSVLRQMYPPFEGLGVPFPKLKIRKMKTRWGSCIPSKKVITLNTRLMNYSRRCIEYVTVHELCHFLEPNHSSRFYKRMTEIMPDWRERKEELKKAFPSAEEA